MPRTKQRFTCRYCTVVKIAVPKAGATFDGMLEVKEPSSSKCCHACWKVAQECHDGEATAQQPTDSEAGDGALLESPLATETLSPRTGSPSHCADA